ncbi:MAG TPA: EpsI family protein [Terriglobales bacterium]|nr:EpsI family protein [Terriglobales bacterium]
MSNLVELAPPPPQEGSLVVNLPRWQGVALLLLTAWLYASILAHLFLQWVGPHSDPNFQHGIFVPLFAGFVLWQDRKQLAAITPAPSWAGFPLVLLSMIVLILGVLGADIFLPRVSLLILLAGLILMFQGWTFFRAVLFPWAFLILMIPIPALIINRITFPLQMLAAKLATALLELVGVAHREGNTIYLASGPMDVAEACSGIRSLLTLVTLAIIYGYLMETRRWVRVVLVLSAVPIAVAANSFRVFGTGLLVNFGYADEAEGVPHALAALLVFALALFMLFAVHRAISLIWEGDPVAPRKVAHLEEMPAAEIRTTAGSFRFGMVAVPMLAAAIGLQAHSSTEMVRHAGSLPSQIGGWTGTDIPIDKPTLDILGPGEYLLRDYENASQPEASANLYIPFFPTQKAGDTIHSPDHCLPGAGWIPISRERIQLTRPDGSSVPVNRYVVAKMGERQLVLYWFQAHGRVVASEWSAKYYLISDSIRLNRSDGGMVRLMTPMLEGESADAAQVRMMKLGSQLLPLIDNYIPR